VTFRTNIDTDNNNINKDTTTTITTTNNLTSNNNNNNNNNNTTQNVASDCALETQDSEHECLYIGMTSGETDGNNPDFIVKNCLAYRSFQY